jgi:hypothetical protein
VYLIKNLRAFEPDMLEEEIENEDELLAYEGESYETASTAKKKSTALFECNLKHTRPFSVSDPFNNGRKISGFKCCKDGLMGGSLYITNVNGQKVKPQLIFGVPKLAYPYTTDR